jgi:phospholipid/cholesterol/gamma-HCH transport system ATP-binding protein
VRELNDSLGATSVIVTHDVAETLPLVDYVYVMADGRVVCAGHAGEVRRSGRRSSSSS